MVLKGNYIQFFIKEKSQLLPLYYFRVLFFINLVQLKKQI